MKTHDFWYDLPEELIAQTPLEQRDTSRLLAMNRLTGEVEHKHFYNAHQITELKMLISILEDLFASLILQHKGSYIA